MNNYVGSKLIIVEGLTGSGKSIMAHFIARQLQYNGISAGWVHEGEKPHPILRDVTTSIDSYMAKIRANWITFIDQIKASDEVRVLEASFFNNLFETLLSYNVESLRIIQFSDELQALMEPLNPTLIYLAQDDVEKALERNFNRRGDGFKEYVIKFATSTPLAQKKGWEGYDGMVLFWQAFVSLTDELYQRYRFRKLTIDNSAGDWEKYKQQVLDFLGIPFVQEQKILQAEALPLIGRYKDRGSDRMFTVQFDEGELTINVFLNVRSGLVRHTKNGFFAEGWPFEISFETDELIGNSILQIGGKDVDYLKLVGTTADMVST